MKHAVVALGVLMAAATLSAQQRNNTPNAQRASPHEVQEYVVDGSKITIDYGRPSKRDRVVWGGLRKWGQWWMPGADEATTLTTVDTLVFGELVMPAGVHTLYMLVDEKAPKLIISNETGQFHTVYHPAQDLGRVDLTLKMLTEPVEKLTLAFEPNPSGGGLFKLSWDDREYSTPFTVKKGRP